jgi:hypothetical protein
MFLETSKETLDPLYLNVRWGQQGPPMNQLRKAIYEEECITYARRFISLLCEANDEYNGCIDYVFDILQGSTTVPMAPLYHLRIAIKAAHERDETIQDTFDLMKYFGYDVSFNN